MLIASFCLGDHLTTLVRVTSLTTPSDRMSDTYNLTITDIASDMHKSYTHVFQGENEACLAFAAVIAADEPALVGDMARLLSELRDSPMHKFLP